MLQAPPDQRQRWIRAGVGLVGFAGVLGVILWGTEFFRGGTQAEPEAASGPAPHRAHADAAFEHRQWKVACDRYEELLATDRFNPIAWYRYGYSLHQLKQYKQAEEAYERAMDFSEVKQNATYNMACIYALTERPDDAIAVLRDAVEAGLAVRGGIAEDPDFKSLRDDPEFMRLAMLEEQTRRSRRR